MPGKPFHRRVDGVLLLDKPLGVSSNAVLQRARRAYGALRAGHTGTLDPLASGLLPVCFGEATKLSSEMLDAGKAYRAEIRLGIRTSTGDAEGDVLSDIRPDTNRDQFAAVLEQFRGEIEQVPPMHSALKRNGQALYTLARRGETVERPPRKVMIYRIDLVEFNGPLARILVDCSKGTYIRVLAEDIGEMLGCGAHLSALQRTRVGDFRLDDAIALHLVEEAANRESIDGWLLPPDTLAAARPRVDLSGENAVRFRHGRLVGSCPGPDGTVRVYAQGGGFLGLGCLEDSVLSVQRGMNQEYS